MEKYTLKCILNLLLLVYICGSFQMCDAGTLIVTYQTGMRGERLNRIRFVLQDQSKCQQMYPKGDAYIDDPSGLIRMVVVENLCPGNYTLTFVIPNSDGLLEEVPSRQFSIGSDNVVKIDQVIKLRYASLKAVATLPNGSPPNTYPTITLKDAKQHVYAHSEQGILKATNLLPGRYVIFFDSLQGYHAPAPISVILKPGEEAGPIVGSYLISEK